MDVDALIVRASDVRPCRAAVSHASARRPIEWFVAGLNACRTVTINDRNLTLQWHRPDSRQELGWMDLEGQSVESLGEGFVRLANKAPVDVAELALVLAVLFGVTPEPRRLTTRVLTRRLAELRRAGYDRPDVVETGW